MVYKLYINVYINHFNGYTLIKGLHSMYIAHQRTFMYVIWDKTFIWSLRPHQFDL